MDGCFGFLFGADGARRRVWPKASDVDKKKGRKLDPNEDLRNKGFKAAGEDQLGRRGLPAPRRVFGKATRPRIDSLT